MNPDEEALAIAARIADGSGIDWRTADATPADATNRGVLNQLKAISSLADLHREWAAAPVGDAARALTQWGPLTLIGMIGEGQFGRVYRAWDPRLQRQVALKLLHTAAPELAAAPTRAIEEARMLAQVRHPNVLTVHGAESIDGQVGIWTEFIDGRTLESLIAGHDPLPAADVIAIGIDLCRALAAVHEAGLLHRDVKAQNAMRETGGRIVLMDFGTSHDVERAPAREGDLSGTPLYLAPELFAGNSPSVASDIYALAVLLFYLSTGRHPVPGRTLDDVRSAHAARRPVHVDVVPSDLAGELAAVIERGLATAPAARYSDARAFEAALEQVRSAPAGVLPEAALWSPRRLAAMLAIGLSAAAIVSTAWILKTGGWTTQLPPPGATAVAADLPEPERRRITVPPMKMMAGHTMGQPSRDGRFFPYIDPGDDVAIWDVRTGKTHRVTDAGQSGGTGQGPLMSPNGDRVAYGWKLPDGRHELVIRNADGSWPQTLIPRQAAYEPIPVDWSRDGEQLLCWLIQKDGTFDLVLVPAGGGAVRPVYEDVEQRTVRLSPDGRFVVMRRPAGPAAPARSDLLVIAIGGAGPDGSQARLLLEGQANERHPSWTPDGAHVFFIRDSPTIQGSSDGWIIPVADGAATGGAVLVAEDLGVLPAELLPVAPVSTVSPVGLTDDGSFYRMVSTVHADVYTASIDLTGGAFVAGPPTRILPEKLGDHMAPSWSPDGRFIAFHTVAENLTAGSSAQRLLSIKDPSSGRTWNLPPNLWFTVGFPQWSHDSASVTLWASDAEPSDKQPRAKNGYFRVDVLSGETRRVPVDGQDNAGMFYQYSPDGRDFFYLDLSRGIVARDLSAGLERVVVPAHAVSSVQGFALSPDGQSIAFRRIRSGDDVNTLEVQAAGGTPRTLVEMKEVLRTVGWTPDGQDLLFSKGPAGSRPLWRISALGGEPRDTGFSISNAWNSISFSPDGRRMVYPERLQILELWITPSVLGPRQAGSGRSQR